MYAQTLVPLAEMTFWLVRVRLEKLAHDFGNWRMGQQKQAGGGLSNGR
jgi:hypothetical protein